MFDNNEDITVSWYWHYDELLVIVNIVILSNIVVFCQVYIIHKNFNIVQLYCEHCYNLNELESEM